jgi:hypothetical protein
MELTYSEGFYAGTLPDSSEPGSPHVRNVERMLSFLTLSHPASAKLFILVMDRTIENWVNS